MRLKGRRRGKRSRERKPPPASFSSKFFSRDSHSRPPFRGLKFSGSSWLGEARDIAAHASERQKRRAKVESGRRERCKSWFSCRSGVSPPTVQNKNVSFFALSPSKFPYLGTERRADGRGRVGLACREGELDVAGDWESVFVFSRRRERARGKNKTSAQREPKK